MDIMVLISGLHLARSGLSRTGLSSWGVQRALPLILSPLLLNEEATVLQRRATESL